MSPSYETNLNVCDSIIFNVPSFGYMNDMEHLCRCQQVWGFCCAIRATSHSTPRLISSANCSSVGDNRCTQTGWFDRLVPAAPSREPRDHCFLHHRCVMMMMTELPRHARTRGSRTDVDKNSFVFGIYIHTTSLLRLENFELIGKVPIYFIQGQLHCTPLLFLPCCRNSHRNTVTRNLSCPVFHSRPIC